MALACLYVYSDAKAGRDAGELCGLSTVGTRATRSIDEIVALGADCVLYMPQRCNLKFDGPSPLATAARARDSHSAAAWGP